MIEFQKIIKYFAILLASLIIFSIFKCIIFFVDYTSNVFTNNDNFESEELKTFDLNDEFVNILNTEIGTSKLIIRKGDFFKVETNNKYVEAYTKNGTFFIKEKTRNKKINDTKEILVTIYIPEDKIFDKVFITGGISSIEIDSISSKIFDFEMGAGKTIINNLNVLDETRIIGGVGKLTINSSNLNNASIDCGVGEFNYMGILKGRASINTGVGSVNISLLDDKENYTIYAKKGIGSITIDGEKIKNENTIGTGENSIDIEGGIGNIKLKFLSSITVD